MICTRCANPACVGTCGRAVTFMRNECPLEHVTGVFVSSLIRQREEYAAEAEIQAARVRELEAAIARTRDAALEEAASLCDEKCAEWDDGDYYDTQHIGASRCADAIRSIKSKPAEPSL